MTEVAAQVSSSANALMQELDVITHNLANASTTGYKRTCNSFAQSLAAQQAGTETKSAGGVNLNSALDFSQGNIAETGRSLDFALYGKGFFVIETTEGPLYTRNGTFCINQNGQIVDSEGRAVAGQNGTISIPTSASPSQITVSSDGNISVGGTSIGKFKIVDFKDNQSKLVPVGASCFRMPVEDIQPVESENIVVKQGYQESSNVKIVDELVDMIMVSRLYEANMKFISAQKEASSSLISVAMG